MDTMKRIESFSEPGDGMGKFEDGLLRGREKGTEISPKMFVGLMERSFKSIRCLYPTASDIDFASEIVKFDAERLASQPPMGKFPELAGHIDLLRGERQGFMEITGLGLLETSFYFSWKWYVSRRLNSQHLARYDLFRPQNQCTNVFFPFGKDGVTISDNRDDVPLKEYGEGVKTFRPEYLLKQNPISWIQGAVSAGVLLDDEPSCLFPANPLEYEIMPADCLDDIDEIIRFLTRYCDFWGPCNSIFVDRKLNAVAAEKTNCLVAFRKPAVNGAVAVTACAYLDEKLHTHQIERAKYAARIKGETEETNSDINYHLGARRRYRRLVELTNKEAAGPATIQGALQIVADREVPFPECICLAGEKSMPDKEPAANWTLTQHAAVITGGRKRCLYRSVQDILNPKPIWTEPLKLMLGPGVRMEPEWEKDTDGARWILTEPVKNE
jgi:hypothetical protein